MNAYAWVLENQLIKAVHAHLAFHVPEILDDRFAISLERWVMRWFIPPCKPNTLYITRHPCSSTVLRYLSKGACPLGTELAADIFPHHPAPSPQGEIVGQRYGISRSLGPCAREKSSTPTH